MGQPLGVAAVRKAYEARAREYIAALGSMAAMAPADRTRITTWALGRPGPVLDVGSGPGHWTGHLHDLGVDISGVEPVTGFVADARERFPDVGFRVGCAEALPIADGSLAGILAWYSLIHTDPARIGSAVTEFARALRPGGSLLLGYFAGTELAPFTHAVTTAYAWPAGWIRGELEAAGFRVTAARERHDAGARRHGEVVAARA